MYHCIRSVRVRSQNRQSDHNVSEICTFGPIEFRESRELRILACIERSRNAEYPYILVGRYQEMPTHIRRHRSDGNFSLFCIDFAEVKSFLGNIKPACICIYKHICKCARVA